MLNNQPADHLKHASRYAHLLEKGLLCGPDLEKALDISRKKGKPLDDVILDVFNIDRKDLGRSLEKYYDAKFVAFDNSYEPPFELYEKKKLDPDFLKRYGWVPLKKEGKDIIVLVNNPFDLGRLDEIRFIFGTSRIIPHVALSRDIEQFIDLFHNQYRSDQDMSSLVEDMETDLEADTGDIVDDDEVTEHDSEVVRLVNALLLEAWRRNASDIHIEPNVRARHCMVRFRIDGTCHEFKKLRLPLARPLVSRIKIMSHLDIAERRLPQDGKVKIKLSEVNRILEFRVATMPTIESQEDVVMRLLASGKPMTLDKLGLSHDNLTNFENIIHKSYGLILVVGPTGSGKTTTLHSAVSYINTPEKKIWTAEDPVEISQDGLRQVQVNAKIGLNFASVLRSFLRADPDVIMIGEMRDRETSHIGVEASLTGHLVFSTLHTNTAPETVTRLLDMGLDPFNFADSLLGVLGQRLVKTLCPKCREKYSPSKKELEELALEYGAGFKEQLEKTMTREVALYRAKGCRNCLGGYRGRVGIHELMLNNPGVKKMIKYKKPTEEIREQAVLGGMLSLKQDGITKVLQGLTDIHQVRGAS
jgi:type II secretory ATPase GspE/PulE/Tfp pilus assembly ATPase PilB-like protein